MSPKKAKRLWLDRKVELYSLFQHVQTLLHTYYVHQTKKELTNEEVDKATRELIAAENAFDAAHDGLPKFFRGKTQEE